MSCAKSLLLKNILLPSVLYDLLFLQTYTAIVKQSVATGVPVTTVYVTQLF